VLSVQNLSAAWCATSCSVYAGQISSIFGWSAPTHRDDEVVAGVIKRDLFYGGDVRLEGKQVRYRVPRQAVRDGIIYVTEDRKVEGFFETMSITGNIQTGDRNGQRQPLKIVSWDPHAGKTWIRCPLDPGCTRQRAHHQHPAATSRKS
jgi:ABC-type sugar transport system ATPase subunit